MDELGQLRVYVSSEHFPLYHQIAKCRLFQQNSEFFILCAVIGEKYKIPVDVKNKKELCRAVTLSAYDRTIVKSLYYKGHKQLVDFKTMLQYAEKCAYAGFHYLMINEFTSYIYVIKNEEGQEEYHLKQEQENDLQLALFNYVLAAKQEVPF
ncbi:hypothetical protein I6G82_00825 [Lysinibacillus macroides]|uniref:Uncharacterized protein n=1 Tax=Lysinibacillus macroides TaxID=33935 RepID=A0A0M9DIL3_9BACI|nr:hypothetical protein [Lysinibacillus macroides]KOY82168.1 hypothetical protein ADM90_11040 [Lysinibacillus macroides]QPR68253.1 hypothetical protein I6G82_00825 [Lysinibacillus macroides]